MDVVRVAVPRTPVTEQMIEEEREGWREIAGNRVPPSAYLEILDRFDVPDSLPAIQSLHVDSEGNLWAQRRTTRERLFRGDYVVLDPSGVWIANASVPDSIGYISDISKDVIAVFGSGPLGEPVVHVHAIHKAGGDR